MAGELEQEDESSFSGPRFRPPVYRQRYSAALEVATRVKAKHVVDMGCAECKLLRLMRQQVHVEELVGVDIDGQLLRQQENFIQPLTTDYLFPRQQPLHITLMQGSIGEPDQRIVNCDLLTCVEVIEHLELDVLERVPGSLFGAIHPKVVVVTTPNSEFNVLFPNLTGFRHHDHKFEWTREQFQSWCLEIAGKYCYCVEFSGVGDPPCGYEHLGYCSQMATFTSQRPPENTLEVLGTPYTVVAEATYPYLTNPPSPEEKLCYEAVYYLNVLAQNKREASEECDREQNDGEAEAAGTHCNFCGGCVDVGSIHVGLKEILKFPRIKQLSTSEDDIRSALKLSTSVRLECTNRCAVYPQTDEYSDSSSTSEDESEPVIGSCVASEAKAGGLGGDETAENWD